MQPYDKDKNSYESNEDESSARRIFDNVSGVDIHECYESTADSEDVNDVFNCPPIFFSEYFLKVFFVQVTP